jgi:hypothetical protein
VCLEQLACAEGRLGHAIRHLLGGQLPEFAHCVLPSLARCYVANRAEPISLHGCSLVSIGP